MAKQKKKNADAGGHLLVTLMSTGVSLVMRKVLGTAWTKARGKEPPVDLTDPRVTFGEAIGWAVLLASPWRRRGSSSSAPWQSARCPKPATPSNAQAPG